MVDDTKNLLRTRLLDIRKQASGNFDAIELIKGRLLERLSHSSFKKLGFYFAIRNEIDVRDVVSAWLAADSRRVAALPCVDQDLMQFLAWTSDSKLATGKFGIPVPVSTQVITPDVLVVPCVGFDKNNYRLGYGGGFYDRYLASCAKRRPHTIGIAFSQCCVETVNPQAFDISLDEIITEKD